MKELIAIQNKPALISVNFDELKGHLSAELEKYDVVVTGETVAAAKKLATELNATKKVINDARKAEAAKASEPVRIFEEKMKDLAKMVENGRQRLLEQVQRFEDETREKVRELMKAKRAELWEQNNIDAEFRRAEYDDLVLLTSITGKGNLAAGARGKLEGRVIADKQLQDQTRMRLLQLENDSYKAGLAAPLSRDHVQPFLFADDERYRAELDRILAAEVQRQEQAEQRMRQQIDRENAQRAQQAEREAQRQQATAQEDPDPTAPSQPAPVEPPAQEPPAQQPMPAAASGRDAVRVICTLDTDVPPTVSDAEVEAEVRRVLEKAGITTLTSVQVYRSRSEAA